MSILCKLGLHRWKPHYGWFAGYTYWVILGIPVIHPPGTTRIGERCKRCGKVRR